jgi:hypothetical protein
MSLMAVAGVIFKCLLIACSVRPGQVMRWPFLIARRRVYFVGMNISLCK